MSARMAALRSPAVSFEEVALRYSRHLRACRESTNGDLLNCPAAEHLKGYFERGKMMRPILVFLSAAAVGGNADDALPAAEAIELLHVAALIHDDIIDCAEERRGLPALHRCIGKAAALVVGDHLILQAFEVVARSVENKNSGRVLRAVRLLSRYAQECCRGQIEELEPASVSSPRKQYFSVVRGKTASQFAAAVTLGAIFGKGRGADRRALRGFGVNAGIAFQIRDDELDLTGDSLVMGKPVANSIEAGRPLLPLIYLAGYGSQEALDAFAAMQADPASRHEFVRLMEKEGLLEKVRRMERRYLSRAIASLENLAASPERDALQAIAVYSVYRDY